MVPRPKTLRAGIALATRDGDHQRADELRAEYYTEQLAEKIQTTVNKAPPLTPEQVERLRALLPMPVSQPEEAA